jgi:hypothetical protein
VISDVLRVGLLLAKAAVALIFIAVLFANPLLELYEYSEYHLPEFDELAIGVLLLLGFVMFSRSFIIRLLRSAILKNESWILPGMSVQAPRFRSGPSSCPLHHLV